MNIKILNNRTNTILKSDFKVANSYKKRLIGLMFKKDINYGLIIKVKGKHKINSSIHSYFMNFPIYLYFINNNYEIEETGYLKPWSTYKPKNKAKYIIESKTRQNLKKGDKLKFI